MQIIIQSPIGMSIRLDLSYLYNTILLKHPALNGYESEIIKSIETPFVIRRSLHDENVLLHYSIFEKRLLCSVIKIAESYSFLITAYPCDSVKKGETLWQK